MGTAVLQHQARSHGIRILILKGRALSRQGLRAPRTSSDVDVLVEPRRFVEFLELIKADGWSEFVDTFASVTFTTHSRTLRRDGWPNSIDVHSFWPGFLRPAHDVFELLWARRESMSFAHQACDVPDRTANLLMLALHSLRGSTTQTRHQLELDGILHLRLTDDERADAAALAAATGSAAPLRHVLPRIGVDVAIDPSVLTTPEYREWNRKVIQAQTRGRAVSWLLELRRVPWTHKHVVLRHGLWPTDQDLLAEKPEVPDCASAKFEARIVRLGRGLAQLPRVIPALRRRRP